MSETVAKRPIPLAPLIALLCAAATLVGLVRPLPATAAEPAAVIGRVLDATGAPVIGAAVSVDGPGPARTATSGEDGRYNVPVDAAGRYLLTVAAPAEWHLAEVGGDRWYDVTSTDGATSAGDFRLRAATHTGVVTLPGGAPAPGATVYATGGSDTGDPRVDHELTATADAQGRYALALTPGPWEVVSLPAQDAPATLANSTAASFDVAPGATGQQAPALQLQPGTARGTVVAPIGAGGADVPVADPVVTVAGTPLRARAFADGSWLAALPAGSHTLRADAGIDLPGGRNVRSDVKSVQVPASGVGQAPAHRLVPGSTPGIVVDPAGQPVPGASVAVEGEEDDRRFLATTDWAGRFTVQVVTVNQRQEVRALPGAADLRLAGAGVATMAVGATSARVTLPDPTVAGRILRPNGTPYLLDTRVEADAADVLTTSRRDGRWGLVLPAGTHELVASPVKDDDERLQTTTRTVEAPASGRADGADFSLATPRLRGTVTGPDGAPVKGARVSVFDLGKAEALDVDDFTSATGTYGMQLAPGRYRVIARPVTGGISAELTAVTAEVTVPEGGTTLALELGRTRDLPWTVRRVSVDGVGDSAGGAEPALSGNGAVVALATDGDLDPTSSPDGRSHVFVTNVAGGEPRRADLPAPGTPLPPESTAGSNEPSLDADGNVIAFTSDLELVGEARERQVYVRDLAAGTTVWAGRPGEGGDAETTTGQPSLSGDGKAIVFLANGRLLAGAPETGVYRRDLVSNALTLLSSADADDVDAPRLSQDGSTATWVETDTDGDSVLRIEQLTGSGDATVPADSAGAMSADGSVVGFVGVNASDKPVLRVWKRSGGIQDVEPFPGIGTALYEPFPTLDPAGEHIVFAAPNPYHDTNDTQVWRKPLAGGPAEMVSIGRDGAGAYDGANYAAAGGDSVAYVTPYNGDSPIRDVEVATPRRAGPPSWPSADGALRVVARTATSLTLAWDPATDDRGVAGYRLRQGDSVIATLDGAARQHRVTGLAADTELTFTIEAFDGDGQTSDPDPSATGRTLPSAGNGTGALAAAYETGGKVRLTWDPATAPQASGLRLLRAIGDAAYAPVADLGADATSYLDAGVPAGTRLRYVVEVLAGSESSPLTREATVDTPALQTPTAVRYAAELHDNRALVPGKPLPLLVQAEPGRSVEMRAALESWLDADGDMLEQPRRFTVTVPLTEDGDVPGTYRGTFPLPEKTSSLESLTGVVSDGHGAESSASAPRLPINVAGTLRVVVQGPDNAIPDSVLRDLSRLTGSGFTDSIDGGTTKEHLVLPAADHEVRVVNASGRTLAVKTARVRGGLTESVTLEPALPASLQLSLPAPSGTDPFCSTVTVTDTEGRYVDSGRICGTAAGRLVRTGASGDRLRITVQPDRDARVTAPEPKVVTLQPGENAHSIEIPALPAVELTGTVTTEAGAAKGASVVVTQTVEGRAFTTRTAARPDGTYSLEALAGPATVTARYGRTLNREVTLTGPTQTLDLDLPRPQLYNVRVLLRTGEPGGALSNPLPIHWTVATHLNLQFSVTNGGTMPSYRGGKGDGENEFTVSAAPGDEVKVCANGRQAGYGNRYVCDSVVLPPSTTDTLDVELRLQGAARVTGTIRKADGTDLNRGWYATLTTADAAARAVSIDDGSGGWAGRPRPSAFSLDVAEAGNYVLTIAANDGTVHRRNITVDTGEVLNLGDVLMRRNARFSSAVNEIEPFRTSVVPGGMADLRATFRNDGTDTARDVRLRLHVPGGTTLRRDAVTLNGNVVPVEGDGDIVLGDLAPGAGGVVVYSLVLGGGAAPGDLVTADASLRVGGSGTPEPLDPGRFRVVGVTLDVPDSSSFREIRVSGRAPGGATVRVLLGNLPIGTAVAGEGGFWSADVELPDRGQREEYSLQAVTELDGAALTSPIRRVHYTSGVAEMTGIKLYQEEDGKAVRVQSFDPRNGVARFPYVVVPGQPTIVEATFNAPESVTSTTVQLGTRKVTATRQADGVFKAVFPRGEVRGDLDVDFTANAPLIDIQAPHPDEPDLRNGLPGVFEGATGPQWEWVNGVAQTTVTVPKAGIDLDMRMELTDLESYTPTASDKAMAQRLGIPAYEIRDGVVNGDYYMSAVFEVPVQVEDVVARGGIVNVFKRLVLKPGNAKKLVGVADAGDGFKDAWTSDDKYDRLNTMLDSVMGCTAPGAAQVREQLVNFSEQAMARDIAQAGIEILALLAAPVTLGGSIAVFAASEALEAGLDYVFNSQLDETQKWIDSLECEKEEKEGDGGDNGPPDSPDAPDDGDDNDAPAPDGDDGGDSPSASPEWIYDPSGYAFEGTRDTRVEGVQVTLLRGATENGPWTVQEMSGYGQTNPVTTDEDGRYGWDVPEGWWKVAWSAPGYASGESRVLRVLPPHFDVDLPLVRLAAPSIESAERAEDGSVTVRFDTWVLRSSLGGDALALRDAQGDVVPAELSMVESGTAEDGSPIVRSVRFVPADATATIRDVRAQGPLSSYAGVVLPGEQVVPVSTQDAAAALLELDAMVVTFRAERKISAATEAGLRDRIERAVELIRKGSETRTIGYLQQLVARVENQVRDARAREALVSATQRIIADLWAAEDRENAA